MKKIVSLILAAAMAFCLSASAFAALGDFEGFTLTINSKTESADDAPILQARPGTQDVAKYSKLTDVVTVPSGTTFTVSNEKRDEPIVVVVVAYSYCSKEMPYYFENAKDCYIGGDVEYYLSTREKNNYGEVGNGVYWSSTASETVTSNTEDVLLLNKGESITFTLPESLTKSDNVVYRLYSRYYVEDTDTIYWHNENFRIDKTKQADIFTDVPSSVYYADAVKWAVKNKVTTGATATTFAPAATVTRAEAVTFLWRAAGSPEPTSTSSPFKDVQDSSKYYYKAVLWAYENGITTGVGATWFDLKATLSYDQIFAFMCRAAGKSASGNDWSATAVSWAEENGLTSGLNVTAKGNCPRSDVVYCLWKQLG